MAGVDDLVRLIAAHYRGDESFEQLVGSIAEAAHAAGKSGVANSLEGCLKREKKRADNAKSASTQLQLQPLQSMSNNKVRSFAPQISLSDLVLSDEIRAAMQRVIDEHSKAEVLREYGYEPSRKLLLHGPPGTGKTATAHAIAKALNLPICIPQNHACIDSLLGESMKNFAAVFEMMVRYRGVYFFDEFDSVAAAREGDSHDVGDMRRLVNSLLMWIEADTSQSVIIAATNSYSKIDKAFRRRFDCVLEYRAPTTEEGVSIMRMVLQRFDTSKVDWDTIAKHHILGLSHAELKSVCHQAAKDALLADSTAITSEQLKALIRQRRGSDTLIT